VAEAVLDFWPLDGGRAMKFYYFHLMPYVMEHDEPSSWVTLSNRLYDPKARPDALQPVPRQLEYARRWLGRPAA